MEEVPGRSIHGISISSAPFSGGLRATFEGRNLTDNRVSDVSGFPLPGRSFYLTIDFNSHGGKDVSSD
jgi:hypothetical protein